MTNNNSLLRMFALRIAAAALCLITVGCTTKSSSTGDHGDPIPTQSMHLQARIDAKDDHTAVVSLRVTDGQPLGIQYRLDGGDYFRVCVAAQCRNLIDDYSQLGAYLPFFPLGYANKLGFLEATDYVISFNRPDARSAPESRVRLPESFNIDAPTAGQQVTDGDVALVSWSPSGTAHRVELRADADCRLANGQHASADDVSYVDANGDGREFIDIDEIVGRVRAQVLSSPVYRCDIEVVVSHERSGSIDPAFRGGYLIGVVSRKVVIDYIPR